jgi:hypothetical protein
MPCVIPPLAEPARTAIVVFEDRKARGLLRLLRPGFRHCFCLLHVGDGWLLCDPLKGGLRLDLLPPYEAGDLIHHYTTSGRHASLGPAPQDMPTARLGAWPLTCVEIVKRALGLIAPRVLTPLQLHTKLISTTGWIIYPKISSHA